MLRHLYLSSEIVTHQQSSGEPAFLKLSESLLNRDTSQIPKTVTTPVGRAIFHDLKLSRHL